MNARLPAIETVRSALLLDEERGVLRWRFDVRTTSGKLTSTRAGSVAGGRSRTVRVGGVYCPAASIAWMLAYGELPKGSVVPLDGDSSNLRPSNLLDCGASFAAEDDARTALNITLDALEARAIFSYEQDTGILRWRATRRTSLGYVTARAGDSVGGGDRKGYLVVMFQAPRSPRPRHYFVHRIIWLIQTGRWPDAEVDHINGVKSDNRWANLRAADDVLNSQNRRRANSNNGTGFLGVTQDKRTGLYVSRIGHEGRVHILGKYATPDEAHAVYVETKRRIHAGGTL